MSRRHWWETGSATWIVYDPTAELLQESVKVTRRMQRMSMPSAAKVAIKKVAPPGRLMARAAVQAAALRATGNPTAAMAVPQFRGHRTDRTPTPPAVVGIMSDVSGSMRWSTTGVGEAAWLLARGAAHAGARVASVVFGEGVDPIVFPGDVPQQIVVRSAVDYTESPDLALAALDGALDLSSATFGGAPVSRVVVILSDMCWRPEEIHKFAVRARALAVSGVRFIVLGLDGNITNPGVADEIQQALGIHTPLPRHFWDDTHPEHMSVVRAYRQHFAGHPERTFTQVPAARVTAAERYARPAGAPMELEPMVAVYRSMLGDYTPGRWDEFPASRVRDQIVSYTLDALAGMSGPGLLG